jgi:hypothetical protein
MPTFGQKATFQEIRLYPNAEYLNPKEKTITIIFPIIITKDQSVSQRINKKLKEAMFSLEKNENLKSELNREIKDGLTDVSYQVTYNKNYILSLNIYTEESGGNHLVHETSYFNFDLTNGYEIKLSDLIRQKKIDPFQSKVFGDRMDSINSYMQKQLVLFKKKTIDSSQYQWIAETIEQEKNVDMSKDFGETFIISSKGLEIVEPIEFPTPMAYLEPTFQLKYSFDTIKEFINSEYFARLKK